MLRNVKIIIAWLAIMLLGIFVAMNTQTVALRIPFDIGLHAPLGLVLLATALLGALGASAFRTLGRWARGKERRPTPAQRPPAQGPPADAPPLAPPRTDATKIDPG